MSAGISSLLVAVQKSVTAKSVESERSDLETQVRECRRLVSYWLALEEERQQLTERIARPGEDFQQIEEALDQCDAIRETLVKWSRQFVARASQRGAYDVCRDSR